MNRVVISKKVLIAGTAALLATVSTAALAQDDRPEPRPTAPQPVAAQPSQPQVIVVRERAWLGRDYRSPGLAAALSLTPVPIDFGNFYAENVDWAIAYTAGEVALGGAMMWVGAPHMCHHSATCESWNEGDRNTMVGLVAGYAALKIVAAFHAASAAQEFDQVRESPAWAPVVAPSASGLVAGFGARF